MVIDPPAPEGMTKYYVALLRRGPSWAEGTPEAEGLQEKHLANIFQMRAAGDVLQSGPFIGQSGTAALEGLLILEQPTLEAARDLVAQDPAVQAGRLVAEVIPWLSPTPVG